MLFQRFLKQGVTGSTQRKPLSFFLSYPIWRWALIIGIWTIVVLLVSGDCYLHYSLTEEARIPFAQSFIDAAPIWYPWAFLTPIVLFAANRLHPRKVVWFIGLPVLGVVGLLLSLLKVFGVWGARTLLEGQLLETALTAQELSGIITRSLPVNFGAFAAIAGVSYLYGAFREQREREFNAAQLEAQLAVSQLRALKMQLQPHFVMNVLNTITAMIEKDPQQAEIMTVRLGELLRMVLDNRETHTIPLSQEIDFLKKYLAIEQARFGDQLEVDLHVDPNALQHEVPNLILQPLVENAIKHRQIKSGRPTIIRIDIKSKPEMIHMRVEDNGRGLDSGNEPPSTGIGLTNTKARLEGLYGADYQLTFSSATPSGLIVDLHLPHHIQSNLEP